MMVPTRILQISDTHIFAEEHRCLLGLNTQESLRAVINSINSETKKPDLILITGDLSQDESEQSYLKIAELVSLVNVPVYFIPGNHDNYEVITKTYPYQRVLKKNHVLLNKWQLILLSSLKTGHVSGYLEQNELDHLRDCLSQYPEYPAIVALHHQPVTVGSAWLDRIGLLNKDSFWEIIDNFSNVKIVLFGHVHQLHESVRKNINCMSVPSTSIQFMPNKDEFSLEKIPQAWRWLDLYPEGKFETGIVRLPSYIGHFDNNAKGY